MSQLPFGTNYNKENYNKIIKKFESRLYEYDPCSLNTIACYLFDDEKKIRRFENNLWKKRYSIGRCEVNGLGSPCFCSPSFLNQLGFQVQREIERAVDIKDIHKLSPALIRIVPFYSNSMFNDYGFFNFDENVDGTCYSYFQCALDLYYPNVFDLPKPMFWVRYYSPVEPSRHISTEEDVNENNILFEICNTVPKSFPEYKNLPEYVLDCIEEMKLNGYMKSYENYERWTYNPNYWMGIFTQYLNLAILKNRKAEERAVKRAMKTKKNQKIQVQINPELYDYYPDVTFTLNFVDTVTNSTIEALTDIMNNINTGEESIECFDIEKTDDNCCEITIDFGKCDPSAIDIIINAIENSDLQIENIVIG